MRMGVRLDVPERVWLDGILVASDLLLFEAPLGQLDLVREEITSL